MNNVYISVYCNFDKFDVILTSNNPNIVLKEYNCIETLNDLLELISMFKDKKNLTVHFILNLDGRKVHLNTIVNLIIHIQNIRLFKIAECKDSLELLIKHFKNSNLDIGNYIIKSL